MSSEVEMITGKFGYPKFAKHLFNDLPSGDINFEKDFKYVIKNIIENGSGDDWEELVRYYGFRKVRNTVMKIYKEMPKPAKDRVSKYFRLKP
jgi:hypothetical protein